MIYSGLLAVSTRLKGHCKIINNTTWENILSSTIPTFSLLNQFNQTGDLGPWPCPHELVELIFR